MNLPESSSSEIDVSFDGFEAWTRWHTENPRIFDAGLIRGLADRIIGGAIHEPLTGRKIRGSKLKRTDGNWREGLLYRGISSRTRAVMRAIEATFGDVNPNDFRVYAPEAVTPFALRLRGIFPMFLGSEWTDDPARRANMYPIPFEDLMSLSLPSDTFDLVSTNEVLEHIPDIDAALREIARVLRPGGWHIGTHPFAFMKFSSIVKARIENGQLVHLMEPEIHGNPFGDGGSLVFTIPGWDILQRASAAGFSYAAMRFIASRRYGCLSDGVTGIFVLCCRK